MDLSKELQTAKEAALKAGAKIAEIYSGYINGGSDINITAKTNNSPITTTDKQANDIIVNKLREAFPVYSILSEELKDDLSRLKSKYCWIVDPLDGTKEFIKKNGEFTVNIALSYEKRAVLGVIYVPVTDELFYASKGNGAYYEARNNAGNAGRIQVSDRTENLRMVMSRSHPSEELARLIKKYSITETKSAGSSLKGCLVAKGEAEAYYRYGKTMEWDTAAMQCIAEESGAVFMQMDDTKMLYNREDSLNAKGFYIINRQENKMVL